MTKVTPEAEFIDPVTEVTCLRLPRNFVGGMALTSLVVCAGLKAVQVLSQLRELNIEVEHCSDLATAAVPVDRRSISMP